MGGFLVDMPKLLQQKRFLTKASLPRAIPTLENGKFLLDLLDFTIWKGCNTDLRCVLCGQEVGLVQRTSYVVEKLFKQTIPGMFHCL